MKTYVAFLRGINVGGHHKVPMKDLKHLLEQNNYKNVTTLLNSGNIIFDGNEASAEEIQQQLSCMLEEEFGFSIPTLVKTKSEIATILEQNPFLSVSLNKDLKLYVSFVFDPLPKQLNLKDLETESFKIIKINSHEIFSVLNTIKGKTTKAMENMDRHFNKSLTTRNWNTIGKIGKKLR